jgi:hypothetical protein
MFLSYSYGYARFYIVFDFMKMNNSMISAITKIWMVFVTCELLLLIFEGSKRPTIHNYFSNLHGIKVTS